MTQPKPMTTATKSRMLCRGPNGSGSSRQATATTTREDRRRSVTLRREAAGEDQAGRDQGEEGQRRSERVDQAGGAHPVRDPGRRAGREAHGRVGLEDPADRSARHRRPRGAPGRRRRRDRRAGAGPPRTRRRRLSSPARTKLALCTQPYGPLASRLSGWRTRSKPSRVRTWTTAVVTKIGPATTPASRARRRAPETADDCGTMAVGGRRERSWRGSSRKGSSVLTAASSRPRRSRHEEAEKNCRG